MSRRRSVHATALTVCALSAAAVSGCAHQTSPTSVAGPPVQAPASAPAPATPTPREQSLGAFTVTCHTGSGQTASGRRDGPGLAAVDTDVFPLGTKLRVEKVGTVTAADRGSAVDGRSLDVWAASAADCTSFGRQKLQVWRPAS